MKIRMLSAGLKGGEGKVQYSGKKLSASDVKGIHEGAEQLISQLNTVHSPLVLFIGNSASYFYQALTPIQITQLNIHMAPMSGGLPSTIAPDLAKQYATNVLHRAVSAKPFETVILVDVYGTGRSKEEFVALLTACEEPLGLPEGTLSSPKQIPIVDVTKTNIPKPASVPFLGSPVVVRVPCLVDGLTNNEYARIEPNYPIPAWKLTPEEVASQDSLDALGRTEIIKTIKSGELREVLDGILA